MAERFLGELRRQRPKGDALMKAAPQGGVDGGYSVGARYEGAAELLESLQELRGLGELPAPPRVGAIGQKGVRLVQDEERAPLFCLAKHSGDLFLSNSYKG